MGKFTKWLGAGLGFTLGGPIGAIIGYAIGSVIDGVKVSDYVLEQEEYNRKEQERPRVRRKTTSGDFEISLLILASVVIKSDGKIDPVELDFVRKHFINLYGQDRANRAFKLFNGIIKKDISTRQVCIQIREHMSHSSRLQLIHFLFGIAKADGNVTPSEEEAIQKISNYLYISSIDYQSIKAMFYNESDAAYKILEIEKNVSDDEVKKAYRKMAKKYHPDRLHDIGEEHKEAAKEKFQSIQKAYENIKKERDIS
ncbi:TerB family tellurite resistance protein [Tenacibaculum sp. M341]|uniref:TerB family tellurite resistance protein n=1 Tax=Tenacibaculum sp. M341 TaxID=2530339 RepID=UPI001044855B|nr:TerB family tellurite resistance protein [Tenacibaculum sp. M341]TCI94185.1 molecular chaperone DjiA [Tenacibaculum sp. M341]